MMHLTAKVSGQVQGVGFRATTCHFAEKLHLTGYIRNCVDGTVEMEVEGEKGQLEQLIAKLQAAFEPYIVQFDHQYSKQLHGYTEFQAF